MPWLLAFSGSEEIVEDQLTLAYSLLNKLLLTTGNHLVFNDLGDKLLKAIDEVRQLHPFFASEFKVFLLANMASNSINLGKKAQANKLVSQLDGLRKESWFNIHLLKASLKISVNQMNEADTLIRGVDEATHERAVLQVMTLFS